MFNQRLQRYSATVAVPAVRDHSRTLAADHIRLPPRLNTPLSPRMCNNKCNKQSQLFRGFRGPISADGGKIAAEREADYTPVGTVRM